MRTQLEINQEYTQCVTAYGDKVFKQKILQGEISQLEQKMFTLNQEKPSDAPTVPALHEVKE